MAPGDKKGISERQADPARLAAGRVLFSVLEKGAFSNLISIQMLDGDDLEPLDRRFASAVVYGTISRIITIDWLIGKASSRKLIKLDPWIRTILRMGTWQIYWARSVPKPAAIDESVRLARYLSNPGAAGYVNAVLRRISGQPLDLPQGDPSVRYSLPTELFGIFRKAYGSDEAGKLAESFLMQDVKVTARVNLLQSTSQEVVKELEQAGIVSETGLYCPEAIRLDLRGQSIRNLHSWQSGRLSVQDEAAMLAGHAASPSPGQLIVDLCAAPGGKTCHLAELTNDESRILALDIHPGRLQLVAEQAKRLRLNSIACRIGDATAAGLQAELANTADLVIADVPCSGLGLLGKKPEIRLTMNYQKIIGLYPLQARILSGAAGLLKPGGVLVYSTCTINPAENIDRVRHFLEETHGRFNLESIINKLPDNLTVHPDIRESASEGWIQLLPHRHGLDGFFIARLRRTA